MNRYHRQMLLPFVGEAGQAKLAGARVLLVGCGALGSAVAEQLVRAGVGHLTVVDRDVVEWTNLQRQVLFDETDARDGVPKAIAAQRRLAAINSSVIVESHVTDVHAGNVELLTCNTGLRPVRNEGEEASAIEQQNGDEKGVRHPYSGDAAEEGCLTPFFSSGDGSLGAGASRAGPRSVERGDGVDLIIDGTDNVETRYLLNDVAVKHGIPWIYGACVGTDGRLMVIRPDVGPCLRCLFPQPPGVGELQTCDTAGVLGPAIAVVAGYQSAAALKILSGNADAVDDGLLTIDFWKNRHHTINTGGRRAGCECCDRREFSFLNRPAEASTAALCGRNSVQVRPATPVRIDLPQLGKRLAGSGVVESSAFLLRVRLSNPGDVVLTVFADGRCIVQGTNDTARARSLVSQFVGT